MDNHRAAVWCWLQHCVQGEALTVLHIDAHYDTAGASGLSIAHQPKTSSLSLEEYLGAHVVDGGERICVYRWDNYISLLQHHHPNLVSRWMFATHKIGQKPSFAYIEVDPCELVKTLSGMRSEARKFVLNLDLDYFRSGEGERLSTVERKRIFAEIAELKASERLLVTTICLSPECCGSWNVSEELLMELLAAIDVSFSLPSDP